ncbi:MAG: hypothetical protein J5674_01355, partial [Candidatus Methanomethylophilaceae archaeon]|nr:hypothetical protein [Candidatus Methanomethylophilaceae archaeon]
HTRQNSLIVGALVWGLIVGGIAEGIDLYTKLSNGGYLSLFRDGYAVYVDGVKRFRLILDAAALMKVMETSELEFITVVKKVSAGKDGFAVHFEVGDKAKDAALGLSMESLEIIDTVGCKAEDAVKAVSNMKGELELDRRLLKDASKAILASASPEDVNGREVYSVTVPGGDRNALSDAAESIRSKGGVAIIVSPGASLSVMLASGDPSVDCRKIINDVLNEFGGRGGGKPEFAQGGAPDPSSAGKVLEVLKEAVSKALV